LPRVERGTLTNAANTKQNHYSKLHMRYMTNKTNSKRAQTSIVLALPVRRALARLKINHGYSKRFAVERGVLMLEQSLRGGEK